MTTMLGVRTNRHCKLDQTYFLRGVCTESDIAHAQKRVCPCKTHLVGKYLYQLAMCMLACGDHIQLQLQNHPARVYTRK